MRNLLFLIAVYCVTLMGGCAAPCSGCRHCANTASAAPGSSHDFSRFTRGYQLTGSTPAGIGCTDETPILAGGGHCGHDDSCTIRIFKDWQQSTGVGEAICSESTGCATEPCIPTGCATAADCAAPIGSNGCTCGSIPNSTAASGGYAQATPTISSGVATSESPATNSDVANTPSAATDLRTTDEGPTDSPPATLPGEQTETPEHQVEVPPPSSLPLIEGELGDGKSGDDQFVPQPSITPQRAVQGVPIEGYPGRGCPVHQQATSPTQPDVSSASPLTAPKSGISGILVGGGFDTHGTRTRKIPVQRVSRTTQPDDQKSVASKQPKKQTPTQQAKPAVDSKSVSPFDWKPKPRVQIQSNGWSAHQGELDMTSGSSKAVTPVAATKETAKESDTPTKPVEGDEPQLLPIPTPTT